MSKIIICIVLLIGIISIRNKEKTFDYKTEATNDFVISYIDDNVEEEENIEKEKEMYNKISAEDAKEIIDMNKDIIILDVRRQDEYDKGHIKNSMLISVENLKNEVEDKIVDRNQKIIVYCRSGRRSKEASDILSELGYKDVSDFGGIIDWPYDIEIK